jgi:Flp pilus assembly protein protease CpaA
MGYLIILALVFIVIAIVKNKKGDYVKQVSFTIMIFSILNCLILQRLGDTGSGDAIYFGMKISYGAVDSIFTFSIIMLLIGLIVYLFSDSNR